MQISTRDYLEFKEKCNAWFCLCVSEKQCSPDFKGVFC